MKEEEIIFHIALSKLKGLGSRNFKRLINEFGSASSIAKARSRDIAALPNIGEHIARQLKNELDLNRAEKIFQLENDKGARVLCYSDPAYPSRLRRMADGPIVLYFKGEQELNPRRTVGIVGTRKPSEEGIDLVNNFVSELKAFNVVTISGLAYGIDGIAHRSSLDNGIPTIGVLAGGLSNIYPKTHLQLANKMCKQGGLLTEFTNDQEMIRENFPVRNRIIAGLSDALIVVESKEQGGSMITAQLAFDYNRFVFAFPGRIIDDKSKGCNKLIKNHIASLIENASDIAELLNWDIGTDETIPAQGMLFNEMSQDEMRLIEIIREEGHRIHIDRLTTLSRYRSGLLANLLLELEFKGVIQSLPGQMYRLRN